MRSRPDLTRRQALATGVAAFVVPVGLSRAAPRQIREPPLAGSFVHGVACGLPSTTAAVLWTRVQGAERAGTLTLEVARDAGFARVVHRERVRAAPVRDSTARRVVSGLEPGERYFYRFASRTASSPVGRFTTARPADSAEPVRVAFFSCQNYTAAYFTAHQALAAEDDLHLVVSLGDYIYERGGPGSVPERADRSAGNDRSEAETLADYRRKYALYRADEHLQAMHAAHPFVAVWDDHEVEDNWAAGKPGTTRRRGIDYATRKRNAINGFFEWMPLTRMPGERDRIYRRIALGGHAEVFLLDTRSYRNPQPCGDEARPGGRACRTVGETRTLLGAEQKAWLLDGLSASPATWKLLGSQVQMSARDLPPGETTEVDQWDGYAAERREIGERLLAGGVRNVAVATGDIHQYIAAQVTTTGHQDGLPFATEFVCGAISSGADLTRRSRDSARLGGLQRLANPHWAFNDGSINGYGILEARADELLVTFKGPQRLDARSSEPVVHARFRVPRGEARIERR